MAKAKARAKSVAKKPKNAKPTGHKTAGSKGAGGKTATKRRAGEMELKHVPWQNVELEDLNPLLQRQFVVGQGIMVARVLMKKGCIITEHSHLKTQLTYIFNGALKFCI